MVYTLVCVCVYCLFRFAATLMLIAWVLFVGMATVIARYYKPIRGDSLLCGAKFWFQVTRRCVMVTCHVMCFVCVPIYHSIKAYILMRIGL